MANSNDNQKGMTIPPKPLEPLNEGATRPPKPTVTPDNTPKHQDGVTPPPKPPTTSSEEKKKG